MSLAIYNNIVEVNPLAEPRPLKVITREWGGREGSLSGCSAAW